LRFTGEHSQAEEQELVERSGRLCVSVAMKGMATPAAESVARELRLLENTE
jgi:hypothetical protein